LAKDLDFMCAVCFFLIRNCSHLCLKVSFFVCFGVYDFLAVSAIDCVEKPNSNVSSEMKNSANSFSHFCTCLWSFRIVKHQNAHADLKTVQQL